MTGSSFLRASALLGLAVFPATIHSVPAAGQELTAWDFAVGFGAIGGELSFADEMFLPDQNLFGGTLALEAGRGVQLRGYYWHGSNEDWDRTAPIFGYGGELQFDLRIFTFLKPFLMGGYGVIDFGDEYQDDRGEAREQADSYILGGGLGLDFTRWFRMDFTVRDYITERPRYLSPEPLDVDRSRVNNLLLTVGMTFTLGRRRGLTSAETGLTGQTAAPVQVVAAPPGVVVAGAGQSVQPPPAGSRATEGGIPLSSLAADEAVELILRTEIGYLDGLYPEQAPLGEPRRQISGERADTLAIRMEYRLHEAFEFLAAQEGEGLLLALDAQLDAYNLGAGAKDRVMAGARRVVELRTSLLRESGVAALSQLDSLNAWNRAERARRRRFSGNLGGSFGNGTQVLVGGQLGFTAPWSPSLAFSADATLGVFGGATTALLQGSLRYFLPREGPEPYAGLGLGVLVLSEALGDRDGSDLVFSPVLGVEVPMPDWKPALGDTFRGYFVEYQAVDFFDQHRLLIGLNWGY